MSASKITKKLSSLTFAALLLGPGTALADYTLNMSPGVTPVGQQIYDFHQMIMWICLIVGVGVYGMIFWSIINHRKSKGAVAAQFHESTTVEVIWTLIPFIILVAIAVPATKTLLAIEDSSDADVTIKATGWQWKWEYDYIDEGVSFFSKLDDKSNEARQLNSGKNLEEIDHYLLNVDKPIVVPVNKKIRILTTANDVIHSWWVPALAVKRDAIPGFINESWFKATKTGTYRGQCAELCGRDHGFMPIVVNVVSNDEYKAWIAQTKAVKAAESAGADKTWSKEDLMARGQEVYNASCASCHQPNGAGIPNIFPGLIGSPLIKGPVQGHIDIVVKGKAGTAMQAFGAQLNAVELAAVITFERNAWGNDSGDVIQPSQISR